MGNAIRSYNYEAGLEPKDKNYLPLDLPMPDYINLN